MLVVDANGDPTGTTTSQVSDANACTTRSINDQWYTGDDLDNEVSMTRALRRGDGSVLNVYFKGLVQVGLLGYTYLPSFYVINRIRDGVFVDDTTIVGGSFAAFNEGVSLFGKM
jgi:hypothetical protein